LKEIKLGVNTDDEVLISIGRCCPLLTLFAVHTFSMVTDRGLSHLASGCRLLEEFDLISEYVTDEGVLCLRACTRLRTFTLYYSQVTVPGICELLEHHRRISYVALSRENESVVEEARNALSMRYPRIVLSIHTEINNENLE
jgi:hypothetical protein